MITEVHKWFDKGIHGNYQSGESVYVDVGIVGVTESTTDDNAHIREPKKITLPNLELKIYCAFRHLWETTFTKICQYYYVCEYP